ncbi:MAG: hypothetical protein KGD68_04785 [Candidatus Lokiarchaeota archaeon]|nr:hypothetical protein [Candidatus Lokiarchaeota archaeon]
MPTFDIDKKTQKIINELYSELPTIKWRNWLDINSKQDYLNNVLKNSGLENVDDIFTKIKSEKIKSSSLSINLETLLNQAPNGEPFIICHTSGTTDSRISALKWYQMTFSNVKRYWAPGMKAIFESSGLKKTNSAVIFVPSRLEFDGLNNVNGKKYISLYSSEFSQRIMISIIKPRSYSFFEYKNATNIEVISKILNLDEIAVLSAPAVTILKWADINKFKDGIERSFKSIKVQNNSQLEKLLKIIKTNSLTTAAKIIQQKLSNKLKNATLVFSISSLSEKDWFLIRKFMNWKQGHERFTNLYVVSEVGPIASSLGNFEISRLNQMYMLPLTLPVLEKNGEKEMLSYSNEKMGKLLISRMEGKNPLINIDIGDVIKIKSQESIPLIDGKILRNSFKLKYPIQINQKIKLPPKYEVIVGDYFEIKGLKFHKPRDVLECVNNNFSKKIDSFLLLINNSNRKLLVPLSNKITSSCKDKVEECIRDKFEGNYPIKLEFVDTNPVSFIKERSVMINNVRSGKIPKGILKKWPLYVISSLK